MVTRVDPSTSSCAGRIDEVFRNYQLELIRFDIRYRDSGGNQYVYASDESSSQSIEQFDEQPVFSLLTTSSVTTQSFNTAGREIAQQSLDAQIIPDMQSALALDHVFLEFANIHATAPGGEPCDLTFPSGGSYAPPPPPPPSWVA